LVNQRRDHYRVYNSQTPVNIPIVASAGSPRRPRARTQAPAGGPKLLSP